MTSSTVVGEDHASTVEFPAEGYREFAVKHSTSAKHNGDLISVSFSAVYDFGRTVDTVDMVEKIADALGFAQEVAEDKLAQVVEQKRAEAAASAPAPSYPAAAPVPGPALQQLEAPPAPPHTADTMPSEGPVFAVGSKPDGKGQLRYVTTASMPQETFKAQIAAGIVAAGHDPNQYVIYDNRTGPRGLEAGADNWFVASVKAADTNPLAMSLGKKSAFYVDFAPDGSVSVKPSKDLDSLSSAMAALQAQGLVSSQV